VNDYGVVEYVTALISQIQGNTGTSPLENTNVSVNAIVIGDYQENNQLSGFFIQEQNEDEISLFDYNDDIQDSSKASFQRESSALPIYEANAFRASNHDPVLVGLDLVKSTLAIDDVSIDNRIILFPNPAGEVVTLLNKKNSILRQATIKDMNGKTVQIINLSDMASQKQFDISQLAVGVYIITIEGEQKIVIKRLIKM
jgi:hypothetical protein